MLRDIILILPAGQLHRPKLLRGVAKPRATGGQSHGFFDPLRGFLNIKRPSLPRITRRLSIRIPGHLESKNSRAGLGTRHTSERTFKARPKPSSIPSTIILDREEQDSHLSAFKE